MPAVSIVEGETPAATPAHAGKRIKTSTTTTSTTALTTPTTTSSQFQTTQTSKIYQPYRALGYITNDLPISIQSRGGKEFFLTTCVGHAFQIYDLNKMGLLFVSQQLPDPITALLSSGDFTYTGNAKGEILVFRRAKLIATWKVPLNGDVNADADEDEDTNMDGETTNTSTPTTIFHLSLFGEYLLALTSDNSLHLFNQKTGSHISTLAFGENFTVSTVMHPSTYLNKILVGSMEGRLQLWNIRTQKLIHEYSLDMEESIGSGIFSSTTNSNSQSPTTNTTPITCLIQAPVLDVVAIGFLDGTIIIHNIRLDERLLTMKQDSKVTSISFRTDGPPLMATASMHGDIALWDLESQKLFHVMKGAHDAGIHSAQFLNGQPLLITAGADNAVKQWIFDDSSSGIAAGLQGSNTFDGGLPRLLKSRSGHHAPPCMIRYYGATSDVFGGGGKWILSAGRDRHLRLFSTVKDAFNVELSQGAGLAKKARMWDTKMDELKLPVITHFSASNAKQKDWDNILTAHTSSTAAKTWSVQNKTIGSHTLTSQTENSTIRTTWISCCGNFGFIGYDSGKFDMFNMQSGYLRKSFHTQPHTKPITGIVSDSMNKLVVSTSLDGFMKFWDFQKSTLLFTLPLSTPITSMLLHPGSNLIAISCDDLGIRIIDLETHKIVREFFGHAGRITDMTFSPDCRWLISSSLDSTIRTWELPTSSLIDILVVSKIPTSVSFSPAGDFLATTHAGENGIFLWSNTTLFWNVELNPIDSVSEERIIEIGKSRHWELPSITSPDNEEEDNEDTVIKTMEMLTVKEQGLIMNGQQLTEEMITLSSLPKSKWSILLNLETIKKRNKPKAPPQKPEKAPFFLPTLPGATPKFIAESKTQTTEESTQQRTSLAFSDLSNIQTPFTRLLHSCHENSAYAELFTYMKPLNPSTIDFEIRSLSHEDVPMFLEALINGLRSRVDFDAYQSYLNLVLKIHGERLMSGEFGELLARVYDVQGSVWRELEEEFRRGRCVLDFVRGGRS